MRPHASCPFWYLELDGGARRSTPEAHLFGGGQWCATTRRSRPQVTRAGTRAAARRRCRRRCASRTTRRSSLPASAKRRRRPCEKRVAEARAKAAEARADADASRAEADAARADADAARASAAVVECDAHFVTALGCSHRVGAAEGSHRDPSLPAQVPTTVEIDFTAALVVRGPPLQPFSQSRRASTPLISPSFSHALRPRAAACPHCPPQPEH